MRSENQTNLQVFSFGEAVALEEEKMTILMPPTAALPHALYRADQVRELDRIAIEEMGIPGATLMRRAGEAGFQLLRKRWPRAKDVTVVCGTGNNGGDGYVVARLARKNGLGARVFQLGDPSRLRGDALAMAKAFAEVGGETLAFDRLPRETDIIVDAVFGTGLEREVAGNWRAALEAINAHPSPVLAIDIPSGLHSDTGNVLGAAVQAEATISFIGLKQGLFTGAGPAYCGDVHFDALAVPAQIYSRMLLSARRLDWHQQSSMLSPRRRNAHKGDFGHVLVIGGCKGFSGAARLAGEAAARSGAGLVSIATHPDHAAFLAMNRPELMCHGVNTAAELHSLLERADVLAVGPGLGRGEWSRTMLNAALDTGLPLVLDADGLNLLVPEPYRRDNWVLTPHPGEAGRLLGQSTAEIQRNRFEAAQRLQARYGGIIVLKGAGSLIQAGGAKPVAICCDGNPGMASGGTGDVLTGIVAGLAAQGFDLEDAACMGVCVHGAAGDRAATKGERGMLATDLLAELRPLLNPGSKAAGASVS